MSTLSSPICGTRFSNMRSKTSFLTFFPHPSCPTSKTGCSVPLKVQGHCEVKNKVASGTQIPWLPQFRAITNHRFKKISQPEFWLHLLEVYFFLLLLYIQHIINVTQWMLLAYPIKAATFFYCHGYSMAILEVGWLEVTLVLELGRRVDMSHSDEGICYLRMTSQGSILRAGKCHCPASGSQTLSFLVPPEIIRSFIADQL